MRRFKGSVKTDVYGSDCDFKFEVEDTATEEEIEQEARETALNYVDFYYEEVEE